MMSTYYQRGQGWKEKWKGWNENETTMKYHDQKIKFRYFLTKFKEGNRIEEKQLQFYFKLCNVITFTVF